MGIETKLISTLTNAKTGTVVKKMLHGEDLQRIIQYGEKTPLRQIGIDTVKITTSSSVQKGKKLKLYEFLNGDQFLFGFKSNSRGTLGVGYYPKEANPLVEPSSISKTIKNFIDAMRASKAIKG